MHPLPENNVPSKRRPILAGWIRGILDVNSIEFIKSKRISQYERYIKSYTGEDVRIFKFEEGAGLFLNNAIESDTLMLASKISEAVFQKSAHNHFYHTCSFYLAAEEAEIPVAIRRSRRCIDNHQEWGGAFFLNGRLFKV